ncbi:Nramp family divalent metal transporter [Enterococcus sp. LJL99]
MKEKKIENETEKLLHYANGPSLEEINDTVEVPKNASFFKTLLAYSGPGALVAVGYMDPGNWITSIAGGADFKYALLSVILLSSLIAMLLQSMAAKLGIVTGRDLAQATREHTSKRMGFFLWIITELAIMATDIAEVIGGAVALQLLFGFPLLLGVIITTFDVLLLLLLTKLGFRKIEAIVSCLIAVIFFVFAYEVALADPAISEILKGFIPDTRIATNKSMLFLALGIVGATVMPHNLYLHSSIAQVRKFDRNDDAEKAKAIRFTIWDSNIQLTVAFIVNCLLLILGGALFYGTNSDLGKFVDLYDALKNPNIVGDIASPVLSILFAVALLASGQNSTITGTLSGQIVMEGFIHLKMPLWMRRVVTRLIAIVPVIICVILYGGQESAVEDLLLYTQVFLSIALPVSIIPLTIYTSDKKIMGNFANAKWVKYLAWIIAIVLTLLNLFLIYGTLTGMNS